MTIRGWWVDRWWSKCRHQLHDEHDKQSVSITHSAGGNGHVDILLTGDCTCGHTPQGVDVIWTLHGALYIGTHSLGGLYMWTHSSGGWTNYMGDYTCRHTPQGTVHLDTCLGGLYMGTQSSGWSLLVDTLLSENNTCGHTPQGGLYIWTDALGGLYMWTQSSEQNWMDEWMDG